MGKSWFYSKYLVSTSETCVYLIVADKLRIFSTHSLVNFLIFHFILALENTLLFLIGLQKVCIQNSQGLTLCCVW